MINGSVFKEKLRGGEICLGTSISSSDPSLAEAVAAVCDFIWVDAEHGALTVEAIQNHAIALRACNKPILARVAWNDPVLVKPLLDLGMDGIIFPLIRTAEEAQRAVAACKYPPEGVRGYGPRRANLFGDLGGGTEYCRKANEAIFITVQIEHIDAVTNLDAILAVPGLSSIFIGPNDLAGSMGHIGDSRHPEVLAAIEEVIVKTRKTNVFVGMGIGDDAEIARGWLAKGAQWLSLGYDISLVRRAMAEVVGKVRPKRIGI